MCGRGARVFLVRFFRGSRREQFPHFLINGHTQYDFRVFGRVYEGLEVTTRFYGTVQPTLYQLP